MKNTGWSARAARRVIAGVIAIQLALPMPVHAAVVSLSQVPLAKTSSTTVLPNLMFILDNSGSMDFEYLPDYIDDPNNCKGDPNVAQLTLTSAQNASVNAVRIVPGGSCTVSVANLIDGTSATSSSGDPFTVASRINAKDLAADVWAIDVVDSTLTISTTGFTPAQLDGCSVQLNVSSGSLSPTTAMFGRKACTGGRVKSGSSFVFRPADPPFQSPDFNKIFYDPEVLYTPGVNADQSLKSSQTNLAAVEINPYVGAGTINLTSAYQETVWCDTTTPTATNISNATATSSGCRVSTIDYDYPSAIYRYPAIRSAQPFYFRHDVIAYCSDEKLTTCIQSETPVFKFPARVRFCKVGNPSDCQEKNNPVTGYIEPNFLTINVPRAAFGRIDVTAVSEGLSVSTIPINGVDAIAGNAIVATSSDTLQSFAQAIVNQINATTTTPEYRACLGTADGNNGCSGTPTNRVTIYPQTATGGTTVLTGSVANGRTVATTAPPLFNSQAKWTITFGNGRTPIRVSSITIGGTNILSGGPFDAPNGLVLDSDKQALASAIAGAVTLGGYTAVVDPADNRRVLVTAPTGTGAGENAKTLAITGSRSSSSTVTIGNSGSNSSVTLRITASSGGANVTSDRIAATGTNDAGEANALAADLAANTVGGYTASAAGNALTVYTPLGTASAATPSSVQTPVPVTAVASKATISVAMTGTSPAWRVGSVGIETCAATDSNILTGAATTNAGTATQFANQVRSLDDLLDTTVVVGGTGASIVITGPNGTGFDGCKVRINASRVSGTGTLTLGGVASSSGAINAVVGTFGGGVNGFPTLASASAFSGGYSNSAMPSSDIVMTRTTNGVTQGPVTVATIDFANGTDSVKTFKRCDIKSNQSCVDASDKFVGNNGTVAGGRFPKGTARTDCAGATFCTYDEERKNFANWYAYYRSRLLSMKTAAGTAFASLGNNFRVGFVTIGNWNQGDGATDFLKLGAFSGTHRSDWYATLYRQDAPNATPLRHALSTVGRYYAGHPVFVNFSAPDPMQYACQKNYALLTTDGYWNESWDTNIKKADNATVMDNADSGPGVPRPFNDGGLGGTCGIGSGQPTQFSSCGTLADVAYHFYTTDLRPTGGTHCLGDAVATVQHDVCKNEVINAEVIPQRMITYTLGLGVDGTLEFQDNYAQLIEGTDFKKINDGVLNWPQVQNLHPTAVDDLWHAAVNGRGQYFSARNPQTLTKSLRNALSLISAETGAGAAAATSNLEPTANDNDVYVASYQTQRWIGNLESRTIDISTGAVSTTAGWCVEDVRREGASTEVLCTGSLRNRVSATSDTRNIYIRKFGAVNALAQTTHLAPFTYDQLSPTQKLYFEPSQLVQYPSFSAPALAAATGESLVNYLRGQTGFEDQDGSAQRLYRDREATLADPVGSQPVFAGKPRFLYADPGYAGFKAAQASRGRTIFIGTNGGMLHAFDASNGSERWAYVPSPVMPNMWELADFNYANLHRFYVDGSPVAADVCVANCTNASTASWKTIVVGGYNAGGKGYYALDVTDPANPTSLWELGDIDMGYSFGNPIVTKRRNSDGTTRWVVLLTSGYNNISTGHGYLYVIDVATGAILNKIDTGAGDPTTPSGLGKIEAFIEDRDADNLTTHVYGGDLLGNVWRFNIDQASPGVVKIATLKDPSGGGQPITTRPLLTKLDDTAQTRYVVVGTGKLLETVDMTDTQVQSLYGFVDKYDATSQTVGTCSGCSHGARDQLTQQTLVSVAGSDDAIRTSGTTSVEPAPANKVEGCVVDFPLAREKMNIDPRIVRGVVSAVTNAPGGDACVDGGVSYISFFDYKTCRVGVNGSYKIRAAMGAGQIVVKTTGGFVTLVTVSDSPTPVVAGSVPPYSGTARTFEGRRVGWRVLFD
jgi:type IV pilus assembly protein PilY1